MIAGLTVAAGDRVDEAQMLVELDRELAAHALETSMAEVQRARAVLADAQRRRDEARVLTADNNLPQSEYEALQAEVAIATANLTAAEASVNQQAARLARHRVLSPFAGVISRRLIELGEWVTPGDTLFELVAIDGLRFDFRVPQELFPVLSETTQVIVSIDALPRQRIVGRISAIVPVNDPASRTFLLRVVPAEEPDPAITPGMSAHAVLRIETGRNGVVVPRDALLRYPDGRVSVWELDRSGQQPSVTERMVKLGLAFGKRVEIIEGLASGVPVVVEGNEALQDGQVVRVHASE